MTRNKKKTVSKTGVFVCFGVHDFQFLLGSRVFQSTMANPTKTVILLWAKNSH